MFILNCQARSTFAFLSISDRTWIAQHIDSFSHPRTWSFHFNQQTWIFQLLTYFFLPLLVDGLSILATNTSSLGKPYLKSWKPSFVSFYSLFFPFQQWRYSVRLENLGEMSVQLRERHWRIFALSGTLETVRGRGVVGQEPILNARSPAFQYSSHISLQAPSGHMW